MAITIGCLRRSELQLAGALRSNQVAAIRRPSLRVESKHDTLTDQLRGKKGLYRGYMEILIIQVE